MRRRTVRSVGKIASYEVYFSGDTDAEPSNETQGRNSIAGNLSSRRSSKEFSKRNVVSKQSQTSETLKWLSENYELVQGVCVPRCVLYTHYLDFCKKRKFNPAGPATFGKLIRQRFPKLTTRRLGTRGQSKYHYYGISIKESSPYYHSLYSAKGLTRFSGTPAAKEGTTWKFCFDKRGGNSLPEFPRASEMILDQNLSIEKVETFIIMYRTHCQRLLDTIMNANFDEVHKFLLHFWQGMPEHMIPVLRCSAVVDIIAVCDSLLYKILNDVLVPSCIQDIPDSLTAEIKTFAITFVNSLQSCLANTPDILRHQKLRVARNFVRLLTRNMTFINLAQTARPVFLSYESMSGILAEFRRLDLKRILSELLFLTEKTNVDLPLLLLVIQEFENLLIKQAPIEAYAEWFDNIVDEFVIKNKSNSDDNSLGKRSENFLTSWSFITSRILEELTLKSASTFGSFQLIIMMFEEYILLVIENQMISRLDADLKCAVTQHLRKPDLRRPENVARICNSIGIGRTTQHEPQEQQDQPEQQQKQEQQLQQQQQQLVLPSVQEQMQQYHTLQLPVAYAMESAQSNFEPQDRSFGQVGHTETINQHRTNALLMSTHAGDFQTGSQYQGLNGASVQYCNNVSIGGTVRQVLSNMPTQTIVCEELDTRVKDTFSQRASFGNRRTLPEANREFGYVSCWRNNYFSGFARAYGQEDNYVTAHQQDPIQDPCQVYNQSQGQGQGQGHNQGQGPGHDQAQGYNQSQGHDQNQSHNQIFQPDQYQSRSYATPHELVQHQGVELDKSQLQGQPQDKGHFQSQGQQPVKSQLDVRGHLQRQGQVQFRGQIQNLQGNDFVSQSNLVHGNVCNGNLSGDSERLETNNITQRSQSNAGYAVSFCSNTSSTEKTALPSFYQLSTQLAANSRLQSRY